MRAFDTNLLVRILTRDDADQVEVIDRALDIVENGNRRADFADALHIGIAATAKHHPLLTFDEGCARLSGAELLR